MISWHVTSSSATIRDKLRTIGGFVMAQARTQKQPTNNNQQSRSMDDAIRRVRAATAAAEQHKAATRQNAIFHKDETISRDPRAKLVQRVAIASFVMGIAIIVFLPENFLTHMIAFSAMFALIFIGVPHLILRKDGAISPTRVVGWSFALFFLGAMTTVAAGPSGNLWDWAPWLSQFNHSGPPITPVAKPH
jgi:hypothetical protein